MRKLEKDRNFDREKLWGQRVQQVTRGTGGPGDQRSQGGVALEGGFALGALEGGGGGEEGGGRRGEDHGAMGPPDFLGFLGTIVRSPTFLFF